MGNKNNIRNQEDIDFPEFPFHSSSQTTNIKPAVKYQIDDILNKNENALDKTIDIPFNGLMNRENTTSKESINIEEGTGLGRKNINKVELTKSPKQKYNKNNKISHSKKKKKHKIRKIILKCFSILFVILLIITMVGGIYAYSIVQDMLKDVPTLDLSKLDTYSKASEIYDNQGNLLTEYGSEKNITWVTYDEMPQYLKDAFVSIEDKRFYEHDGIDKKRLLGAIIGNLTNTASYGGSTITQQLIKNTYLTQERTYKRKIQEIYLAIQLEKELDSEMGKEKAKNTILEWYANTIFLGDSNYGIESASLYYFGKDVKYLTLREAACIAGLGQSPNYYNPRANSENGDMTPTNNRTDTVLYAMHENGKITDQEYEDALEDTLEVRHYTPEDIKTYDNAYFIDYAVRQVAEKLLLREGKEINDNNIAEKKDEIRNGGYKIYTTLDTNAQSILRDSIVNFNNYPGSTSGSEVQASAVIIDHHTGQIISIQGGREEPTVSEGFNRATDSTQAVGSSAKPLGVYAPALDLGYYPGTIIDDIPEDILGYDPANPYEQQWPNGETFNKPITMRKALEASHNIPAARLLLEKVGIEKSFDYYIKEGFNPNHLSKTASGLALGASDVTTLEMAGGYATLANGGVYIEPHTYTKVYDRNGNVVLDEENSIETHRAFSESTAWLITDMMYTNMYEGLGKRARLNNMTACGKTGTHEHKVISFGGYTHYYTSFVRISTDDYADMYNNSSTRQSTTLWKSYMDKLHEGLEDVPIQDKSADDLGIYKIAVCNKTGLLATQDCQWDNSSYMEYVTNTSAPTEYCEHPWNTQDNNTNDYQIWWDENGVAHENGWWDENGLFHLYE